jgi:hypothetical protein
MKKVLFSLVILLYCMASHAQFTAVAGVVGAYNLNTDFNTFRDAYNKTNASTLDKELGSVHLFKGVSVEVNYRILAFVGSLNRTYMSTGNKAVFQNGATRDFDIRQQFTNVMCGFGIDLGTRSEIRCEIGMTHSLSDLYSYVKLPTGEKDYLAGGVSIQSTHVALGFTGRLSYYQGLTDKLSLNIAALYTSAKAKNMDIDPHINYEGITVTHTYNGPLIHFGIAYKLTDREE